MESRAITIYGENLASQQMKRAEDSDPTMQLPLTSAIEMVEITWHDAMNWAARNGVKLYRSEEEDLDATNAARARYGLPRFKIIMQRGRPRRLPLPSIGGGSKGKAKHPQSVFQCNTKCQ
jgi:hypothetical protein